MSIPERLKRLRTYMKEAQIDAYIVTGSDPHGSEYPPPRWRTRNWISGFSGSAGTVVVTADTAGLWTDFRYWIQAVDELHGSGIELFREGEEEVPEPEAWLAKNLESGSVIGFDGRTVSGQVSGKWKKCLTRAGMETIADKAPWDELWQERLEPSDAKAVELDDDESGEPRTRRLDRLREALTSAGADTWIGTALDSSAWLLNVRGGDVPYNPVVMGYLIVSSTDVSWFVDRRKLPEDLLASITEDGIAIEPYENFENAVGNLPTGGTVIIDDSKMSCSIIGLIPENVGKVTGEDPVFQMKSVKNAVEAGNIARAMEKDGVAILRFLIELENVLEKGGKLNELEAAALLLQQRKSLPGFIDESFCPIPAVGGHGAIIHYEAKAESASFLEKGTGLFLIDSGGQWEEGTTDITRTVSLGAAEDSQRTDFTLVLKGHISLSRARFPRGTRGYQLDTLARMHLWTEGRNYGHGTGHGVGYRLNVHEGPQKLSPHPIDVALVPGMIVSNEPGVYREGEYGIRIENLLICREDGKTEFGDFLAFDTLTLAPYDSRLIDVSMLTAAEKAWIDAYHAEVYRRLSPLVEAAENTWLKSRTAPLADA